jgi:hypothetical protein
MLATCATGQMHRWQKFSRIGELAPLGMKCNKEKEVVRKSNEGGDVVTNFLKCHVSSE